MATRLKGQEVEVLITAGSVPQTSITTIKSFEAEVDLELLKEGYLGQTTDQYDEVYHGIKGNMEMHVENRAILDLVRTLVNRSRRRVAGFTVTIKASLNMPDGSRVMIVIANAFFGPVPITAGGRAEFVPVKLDFAAEDFTVI
jgi:hypothetical protein